MLGFDALGRLALGEFGASSTALSTGIYSFTGFAENATIRLVAATYSAAVSGNSAQLNITLSVSVGSFSFVGTTAPLGATLVTAPAAYAVSGNASSFALAMPAGVSSYAISGIAAVIGAVLNAQPVAYSVTGFAVDNITFAVQPGVYVVAPPSVPDGEASTTKRGGTSRKLIEEEPAPRRWDPRLRTGLLPLKKRPQPPKPEAAPEVLPPYRDPPLAPVAAEAPPKIDAPQSAVEMFEAIRRAALDARDQTDIADIEAMLEHLD